MDSGARPRMSLLSAAVLAAALPKDPADDVRPYHPKVGTRSLAEKKARRAKRKQRRRS